MTKEIKEIVIVFLISNFIGLFGVMLFSYTNAKDFAHILMGAGILLHLAWVVMLIIFLINLIRRKHHQVL